MKSIIVNIRDKRTGRTYEINTYEYYPSYLLDVAAGAGYDVTEYDDPMDFLRYDWAGSDHGCWPLNEFIDMIPVVGDATIDDQIVYLNGSYYLIPCGMINNDSPDAIDFWVKLATKAIPSWTITIQ